MGHKNNQIINETIEQLKSMQSFGHSKHQDKKDNTTQDKIYSFSTFNNYKQKCCDFAKYAKKEHHCKNLEQAKPFVVDFLKSKIDANYSIWTIKLYCAALSKLYQEKFSTQIDIPQRHREQIKRSRHDAIRDKHFSETKNQALVDFCKSCGLRRHELENLKGKDLVYQDGQYYIFVESGKGGKSRYVPILYNNQKTIEKMQSVLPNERVWGKVHSCCDVHSLRRDYCNALYNSLCPSFIPKEDRYYCRKDKKGIYYSKPIMSLVSRALGHSRICVIAYNYLDNK